MTGNRRARLSSRTTGTISTTLLIVWIAVGCSDDPVGPGQVGEGSGLPPIAATPDGVLLDEADPGATAAAVTRDMPEWPVEEEHVGAEGLLRTRLEALIASDATVADINAALEAHEARIVAMSGGFDFVALVIPPVVDLDAAQRVASRLVATGAFSIVLPSFAMGGGAVEPAGAARTLPPSGAATIAHLTALRMPAAWNAVELAKKNNHKVTVLVPDSYTSDQNHSEISALTFAPGHASYSTTPNAMGQIFGNHGWHVSGIVGANFDGTAPTGTSPDPTRLLDVKSVNLTRTSMIGRLNTIVRAMPTTGPFVLNTSFSYSKVTNLVGLSRAYRALGALYWRTKVHARVDRSLHATSAANYGATSGAVGEAKFASAFNGARLVGPLTDLTVAEPDTVQQRMFQNEWDKQIERQPAVANRLPNVLVVGSSGTNGTESSFSNRGSEVRAMGEAVLGPCALNDDLCSGTSKTMTASGTSQAAPAVAGLAAYLWNLKPNLTVADVRAKLEYAYTESATPGLIDAYIAVLSLDTSLNAAPVRRAILDVAGAGAASPGTNMKFDEHDVELFLDRLRASGGATRDYSRFDLNGDGFTGGAGTGKVELDADQNFETLTIDVNNVQVQFDETRVTDLDVLCYYAYSDLYLGDPVAPDVLLAECGDQTGLFVVLSDVPERVAAGETALITVTAGFNVEGGDTVFAGGIEISLELDGAEASPDGGITDSQGRFQTTITFGSENNEMTVGVWAESENGAVYTQKIARRQNEVELVERSVFVDAGVFATYAPVAGSPNVEIINQYFFHEVGSFAPVDTTLTKEDSKSADGMSFAGSATAKVRTSLELLSGNQLSEMSIDSESSASMTLTNPNFDVQSYQAQSNANVEAGVKFIVWGDPAQFTMNGSVTSREYDVDLGGPEGGIFECDSNDAPCEQISTGGALPPGQYTLSTYHGNEGMFRWFRDCNGCTTSGTQSSGGRLNVTFKIRHGG